MAQAASTKPRPACPRCGQPAKTVKRVTLEHLLRPALRPQIGDGPWYVCETPDCDVAYFGSDGRVFGLGDLTVPFGIKAATPPPRPVCYCFSHTIEEIEDEIARTGRCTVPQQIQAAMKSEGCRCEQTNPLGRCCLATVQAVIDRTLEHQGATDAPAPAAEPCCCCCASEAEAQLDTTVVRRAGVLATAGSVVAAVLSSACCWLPLAAIALGFSAAGVAGFFERWRIPLVLVAGLLLSVGFWFAYGPPAKAAACCSPRALRVRRGMLWVSTLLVLIAIAFPQLLVAATRTTGSPPAAAAAAVGKTVRLELPVRGMTCEGCAALIKGELSKLPGVTQVEVSYAEKRARLVARGQQAASLRARAIAAIRAAGYDVPEPTTQP